MSQKQKKINHTKILKLCGPCVEETKSKETCEDGHWSPSEHSEFSYIKVCHGCAFVCAYCASMFVSVCERERLERERKEKEREREKETHKLIMPPKQNVC